MACIFLIFCACISFPRIIASWYFWIEFCNLTYFMRLLLLVKVKNGASLQFSGSFFLAISQLSAVHCLDKWFLVLLKIIGDFRLLHRIFQLPSVSDGGIQPSTCLARVNQMAFMQVLPKSVEFAQRAQHLKLPRQQASFLKSSFGQWSRAEFFQCRIVQGVVDVGDFAHARVGGVKPAAQILAEFLTNFPSCELIALDWLQSRQLGGQGDPLFGTLRLQDFVVQRIIGPSRQCQVIYTVILSHFSTAVLRECVKIIDR